MTTPRFAAALSILAALFCASCESSVNNLKEPSVTELSRAQKILNSTIATLQKRVGDDKDAMAAIDKLSHPSKPALESMTIRMKRNFQINEITAENQEKLIKEIETTILATGANELKAYVKGSTGKVSIKICWLVGCE